jgi:GNAT superfamily N-acetyltransferase
MSAIRTPVGLRLRPYAGEPDLAAIARIENAEAEADRLPERVTVDGLVAEYGNPSESFDPARDVTIAEVDGEAVAYGLRNWVDTTDGLREYRVDGSVHPAWRRRGIGTAMLAENERLQRALAASHATPNAKLIGSWSGDTQAGDIALLQGTGFTPVRWFFEMTRPRLDDIPELPLPDGLEVRPITPALARRVWDADIEAFEDHWGGFDRSDESFQRWLDHPATDLSLWLAAFDGDEIAAAIINLIDREENEALGLRRGWLASVFTRRPWRRRGLARALIVRSLALLRDRGMTIAALGVDADNPSGALGLYEDLGFAVSHRATAWRKAL